MLIQTKRTPLSIPVSENDYIKKPLENKRGFLVYVYVLLIYCVFESLAC